MKRTNQGFTITELIVLIGVIIAIIGFIFAVITLIHFIMKMW